MATGDPYCAVHGFTPCRCAEFQRLNVNNFVKLVEDKTNMMNMTAELEHDSLEYKDSIVEKLQEAIEEYMEFSTTKDLLQLVGNVLGN